MPSQNRVIEMKLSLATLVMWAIGGLTTVAGVSTLYGKQEQRVIFVEQQQAAIQKTLDRIEASQQRLDNTISRIEGEWRGRVFPVQSKK